METELFCDAYRLSMAQQTLECGMGDCWRWFEVYFRRVPEKGGFAVAAGLEPVLRQLKQLHFSETSLSFLWKEGEFHPTFLDYLRHLRFTGDVYAVAEGTPIFAGEPFVQLHVPLPIAYLLETRLLQKLGYATLIATKASRIVRAAKGHPVWELSARRTHGIDAAVEGARAAYLGGCAGTSCVAAQQAYDIPVTGTMGHAFVQQFPTEYDAFSAWCARCTSHATLLVDTYDTLHSGVPNVIRAFQEVLLPRGITDFAVCLDSGDLAVLSRQVRRMLDDAGLSTCWILASNALDEYRIQALLDQGAAIDVFGVGERLITTKAEPVLGCVMKLMAIDQKDGMLLPKWKCSESRGKSTLSYPKQIWRCYDSQHRALGDWIAGREETMDQVFSAADAHAESKPLLHTVMHHGTRTAAAPTLMESQGDARCQLADLPESLLRLTKPERYPLHLSEALAAKLRGVR